MKETINKILGNRIFKAGTMSLIATVLTRAINLISVPIFSRILTTAEYGQVDVFMTFVNIFFVVLGLDFHGAVGKGRLDFEEESDRYLCSSLIFTSIFASIFVVFINVFFKYFAVIFGLERWVVNLMFLYSHSYL